jgi:hypothetical protein
VCRAQDPQVIFGISPSVSDVLHVMKMKKSSGSTACAVCSSIGAAVIIAKPHPMLGRGGDVATRIFGRVLGFRLS